MLVALEENLHGKTVLIEISRISIDRTLVTFVTLPTLATLERFDRVASAGAMSIFSRALHLSPFLMFLVLAIGSQ